MPIADAADQRISRPLVPPRRLRREVRRIQRGVRRAGALACVHEISAMPFVPRLAGDWIVIRVVRAGVSQPLRETLIAAVTGVGARDRIRLNEPPAGAPVVIDVR